MNVVNDGVTAIGIICTAVSVYSAYKSFIYFKKSKYLNTYAETNTAYLESKK